MFLSLPNNRFGQLLKAECEKQYFLDLCDFLCHEYEQATVFPKKENIFASLCLTDFDDVKVVILGQDPYHGEGQAHGLAFSVQSGAIPPSLKNIFKELKNDVGTALKISGDLTYLARQGVLLLNTVLTVRKGEPNSHKGKGWELFTDEIIRLLNQKDEPIVFLLWGKNAEAKKNIITSHHHVLTAPHPSPLSASKGFFGCKHFSQVNDILKTPIEW